MYDDCSEAPFQTAVDAATGVCNVADAFYDIANCVSHVANSVCDVNVAYDVCDVANSVYDFANTASLQAAFEKL